MWVFRPAPVRAGRPRLQRASAAPETC